MNPDSNCVIGDNTRLLFDTIVLARERKIPGMIFAAYFEAAFESISWNYLRSVMTHMNFGEDFLKMVDLLYLNNQNYSRIMINGHLGQINTTWSWHKARGRIIRVSI